MEIPVPGRRPTHASLPWPAVVLALALPPAAADRPVLPEPPLGTHSAAFLGGGAGQEAGVGALFTNPGAMSIHAGRELELGVMGLSGGLSPYSLYGGRAGDWTYAAGGFYDQRMGPFRNGFAAGGSREAAPGLSLGGAVRTQGGLRGFGVDADAGLLFRPSGPGLFGDWAALGAAVRNLAESGMGQEPEGYETPRSYLLSLGGHRHSAHVLFLDLQEPGAEYELHAEGLDVHGFSHSISAGAAFTPSGILSLRASVRLPHGGGIQTGVAGLLRLPLAAGGLRLGYAFATGEGPGGGGAPAHSVSLNLALGSRLDRRSPTVSVSVDRAYLAPADPGRHQGEGQGEGRVHFRLHAADEGAAEGALQGGRGQLGEWTLAVVATDRQGRRLGPVRSFQGKDLPPSLIRWDGRDAAGAALKPGYYAFRLSAEDLAGNRSETAWQLVELGAAIPGDSTGGVNGGSGSPRGEEAAPGPATGAGEALPPILEGDDS